MTCLKKGEYDYFPLLNSHLYDVRRLQATSIKTLRKKNREIQLYIFLNPNKYQTEVYKVAEHLEVPKKKSRIRETDMQNAGIQGSRIPFF